MFMKYLLIMSLLLVSNAASSVEYTHLIEYGYPTEREVPNPKHPLGFNDLNKLTIYEIECNINTIKVLRMIKEINLLELFSGPSTRDKDRAAWIDNNPVTCVVLTVTDTDGRESRHSEVFEVSDFRAPKPLTCIQRIN